MNKAPYHDRNQADYVEMTRKIEFALSKLRDDSDIPATEVSLSKLAGCSRNTLRNRKYPLEELKKIKSLRSEDSKKKPSRITKAHFLSVDFHIEENKQLKLQLTQSREETAIWVNKYFALETDSKRLERMNEILQKGKELLETQLKEARSQMIGSGDFNIH